jgi:TolB-like protein
MLVALAPLVAVTPVAAQNAPVVAVLVFENGSFGAGARDYDGIGKGIADVMITDLASSTKVRVVDRSRIQNILDEQKLTSTGAVNAETAVRIGRLMGACYSIYGTYMRGPTGDQVLTVHTTSNETGQIQNAIKETSKGDNVMELIANASTKFANQVNVSACPGNAGARRSGDSPADAAAATAAPVAQQQSVQAQAAQQQSAQPQTAATIAKTTPDKPAAAAADKSVVTYSRVISKEEVAKIRGVKLDARTMLIYSRALDAKDRGENARAKQLAQQVKDKYPAFTPADELLKAASAGN